MRRVFCAPVALAAILGFASAAVAAPIPVGAGPPSAPVLDEVAGRVSRDRVGEAVAKRLVRRQIRRNLARRR